MSIRIVTDSTCDLPQDVVEAYGITVVPLYINYGNQGFLDGVEISREEFYQRLPDSNPLPTSATPGVDAFRDVYERLAKNGASEIISIHISISLSATVDIARQAAEATQSVLVTVLDSQQLSLGTGFLVVTAAKAAAEGMTVDEIIPILEDQASRTYVIAALDTLEFLKRSGRMNGAVARLGNLLRIKPLLIMNAGEPTAERVRTRQRAISRMIEFVSALGPLEEIALVHTNAAKVAKDLYRQARNLFPDSSEPLSVDVTPVLGANIGPGVIGFAVVAAKKVS
jgi:DegV family protein with EDD domain